MGTVLIAFLSQAQPEKIRINPADQFGDFLLDLCQELPVHLMPGASDPTGFAIPQQPMPGSIFGSVSRSENLKCETNPTLFSFDGHRYFHPLGSHYLC